MVSNNDNGRENAVENDGRLHHHHHHHQQQHAQRLQARRRRRYQHSEASSQERRRYGRSSVIFCPFTSISSLAQKFWIHFCGTDHNSASLQYSNLAIDICLMIGAGGIYAEGGLPQVFFSNSGDYTVNDEHLLAPHSSSSSSSSPPSYHTKDLVEFSLLYFSLINGWFLYIHHYSARFTEVSRYSWLLSWMFIISMFYAVTHASMTDIYYVTGDHVDINDRYGDHPLHRSNHNNKSINEDTNDHHIWTSIKHLLTANLNGTISDNTQYKKKKVTNSTSHIMTMVFDQTGGSGHHSSHLAQAAATTKTFMYNYRHFSIAMIYMRLAVFLLLARVAWYVDRAQPLAALLAVFIGDAILCFALSAASDIDSATILWTFVAATELNLDFFLAVGLRGPIQIPCRIGHTMRRVYPLILAPLGGITVQTFLLLSKASSSTQILFGFASMILLMTFGMLFYSLHEGILDIMGTADRSEVKKAALVVVLKLLGYTIWLSGACLLVLLEEEKEDQSSSGPTILMCRCIGATLICFLLLRRIADRPRDWVEFLWCVMVTLPWTLIFWLRKINDGKDTTPMMALSTIVVIVSILNVAQSLDVMGVSDRLWSFNIRGVLTGTSNETDERSATDNDHDDRHDEPEDENGDWTTTEQMPLIPPGGTNGSQIGERDNLYLSI